MMKKWILPVSFVLLSLNLMAQETQLQTANALYKQFKEAEALNAYQQVLASDANNMTALVKCVELCTSLGKKQGDKNNRYQYFLQSKEYADKAMAAHGTDADAYYVQSLAFANLSETETENKKTVEDVKQIKKYADEGLSINPNHALLNYMEGKWHLEMLQLNWLKKTAIKTMYGDGLSKPDIDSAIGYLEKCRVLAPYFVQNYLDLAKAYQYKNRPAQEMEILTETGETAQPHRR